MRASRAFLAQLLTDGVDTIFGNPGTTEESFLDVLPDEPRMRYVVGLQESVVVAMADGYARATHRPSVVQLHAAVGLGNAMAMLYQAHRSFTPLIVFAGEGYSRFAHLDGFLAGDTVRIAGPVTKWSARVAHADHLLPMLRRAYKVAATPPYGPVFLAVPMDVFDAEVSDDSVRPTSLVETRVAPRPEVVDEMARGLMAVETPMLLVGDGVSRSGAQTELAAVAERLGAPVYGLDFSDLNLSFRHPLFQGLVGRSFGSRTRQVTLQADAVLAVGTPLFSELFPVEEPYIKPEAPVYQIDLNTWEVAKNFPVTLGVAADPKETLGALGARLDYLATPESSRRAAARRQLWQGRKNTARAARQRALDAQDNEGLMTPGQMMGAVVSAVPTDVVVYDEALTSSDELLHYLQPDVPDRYYLARGGCIGVGWPGAVGAKFANPGRPVLALSGDGSALSVVQVLWTAARHDLDVVFVVCNNRSYRILKVNILHYWADSGVRPRRFPYMDLDDPPVRWSDLAEGFGVRAWEADTPEQVADAVRKAFAAGGPHLIDVRIDGSVSEEASDLVRAHSGMA